MRVVICVQLVVDRVLTLLLPREGRAALGQDRLGKQGARLEAPASILSIATCKVAAAPPLHHVHLLALLRPTIAIHCSEATVQELWRDVNIEVGGRDLIHNRARCDH